MEFNAGRDLYDCLVHAKDNATFKFRSRSTAAVVTFLFLPKFKVAVLLSPNLNRYRRIAINVRAWYLRDRLEDCPVL